MNGPSFFVQLLQSFLIVSCKSNDCLVFDTSCSRVELDRLYVFNATETQSGILDKGKFDSCCAA